MAYIAPVHKPTSIRHALRIRLLSPVVEDLVIAKSNRLEVWRVTQEGMQCLHSKLVYGTISMLQRLQPKDSATDLLFVGTERFQYFTLSWNSETNQLETIGKVMEDGAEAYMRRSQSLSKCLVDPTGRFMAMHLWEGVLSVLRLPTRKGATTKLDYLDQVRLTEMWMKSSTFIHSRTGHPKIAFLYKTQLDQEDASLAIYRLTKDDKGGEVSKFDPERDREFHEKLHDPYASMLIPVPVEQEKRYNVRHNEAPRAYLGGIIVVGETLLTYFDSLTYASVSSALDGPKIYAAWAEIDGTHYLLADDYGRLDLLTINTTKDPTGELVTGMNINPLRLDDEPVITSRATTLVNMGFGLVFVASHQGDSQLFHVDVESQTANLLTSLSNNAPILDFAIMDMGNREGDQQTGNAFSSGQARIVAGCGAYNDGSMRSIRSGVGLDDQGVLDEIEDSKGLFALKSHGSVKVDTLVVSFIEETRVFRFSPDSSIEELSEFQGFSLDATTLFASNAGNGHLIQISPRTAKLLDLESGVVVSSWEVPDGKTITAASANSRWALLAVDGITLVSLNILNNLQSTVLQASANSESEADQISCIHASSERPDLGVIGWWTSGRISVVDLSTLEAIHGESLRRSKDSASIPRDIALIQLHPRDKSGPTLLVAQEDGNLVTFDISREGFEMSGRKSVTLGNNPARLHILPKEDGTSNVFATTEHASLIYSAEGRIVYSATAADDATFVVPFDSEAFPGSIVLSTDSHLSISHVDKERLTHVKTLPMKETVRRLAYAPNLRAFGLGCIRKELQGDHELITSSFRLVDEIIFQELGEPFVLDASPTLELVETVIHAEVTDFMGNRAERFLIGTSFVTDDEERTVEETLGRIVVLGVDENRQPYQIVSHKLKGACRCLRMMDGKIVAALSKTVVVYNYSETSAIAGALEKIAAYRPSAYPVDLDVHGSMIGVVDILQSLAVVEFVAEDEKGNPKLIERARHMEPVWSTAVCNIGENRWIEADSAGNVMVMQYNNAAPTDALKRQLEVLCELNIGEQINRIRMLNVPSSETSVVSPRAFLASIEGSLYLYGDVSPQYRDVLIKLQERLADIVDAPGSIAFATWRSFRNEAREGKEPFGFVDGEMIERFLDLDEARQLDICDGLGPSVENVRNMIEELRRMH